MLFFTDEEIFEDADDEEGEYHLGEGDASVVSHSKEIILGVLIMYLVKVFHCFQACLNKIICFSSPTS